MVKNRIRELTWLVGSRNVFVLADYPLLFDSKSACSALLLHYHSLPLSELHIC